MKHSPMRLAAAAAVALVTLSACAGLGKSPEAAVLERAQARWDAVIAGNLSEAYEYLSPGYRSAVSLNAWQRRILGQRMSTASSAPRKSRKTGSAPTAHGFTFHRNDPKKIAMPRYLS
ncbi:MAG: hypothetical protein P8008_04015 [Gammaproteobacteria bacterium]